MTNTEIDAMVEKSLNGRRLSDLPAQERNELLEQIIQNEIPGFKAVDYETWANTKP